MRWEAVRQASEAGTVEVGLLCRCVGMSRQNYYKSRRRRERLSIDESLVLELVRRERGRHPRMGVRKLLGLVTPDLSDAGVELGRDRLFELLREHDLLIPKPPRRARTTQSRHGFYVFANLAKSAELTGPNRLWVSDITYVRTLEGFMFLALVMDAWSRTIVGYDCSDSLERDGALRALKMALGQKPRDARVMHHSDRGIQYCCREYIDLLKQDDIAISMTEQNHCYENARAERLNGILKQEYGLGGTLVSKSVAIELSAQGVMLYNEYRPHGALKNQIPMRVHLAA